MSFSGDDRSLIEIYSDGGAVGNPGPGGYGVVIRVNGDEREISAGYRLTTNNRMELMGVISALESTAEAGVDLATLVVTDSRYVVDAMNKGWAEKWRANDWKRSSTQKAMNPDLWSRLLGEVDGREVSFEWVKGHSGHPENERADELVRNAWSMPEDRLLEDPGYSRKGNSSSPSMFEDSESEREKSSDKKRSDSREDGDGKSLSHLDVKGEARMVDVGWKDITERVARASCEVHMSRETLDLVESGGVGKGDVISTARLAGVMAAKRTGDLIPMCHNIPLSQVEILIERLDNGDGLRIEAVAKAIWRTGVEMEAMTGASVAALTVYDMCKSAEKGVVITDLSLRYKSGGKSGEYVADEKR